LRPVGCCPVAPTVVSSQLTLTYPRGHRLSPNATTRGSSYLRSLTRPSRASPQQHHSIRRKLLPSSAATLQTWHFHGTRTSGHHGMKLWQSTITEQHKTPVKLHIGHRLCAIATHWQHRNSSVSVAAQQLPIPVIVRQGSCTSIQKGPLDSDAQFPPPDSPNPFLDDLYTVIRRRPRAYCRAHAEWRQGHSFCRPAARSLLRQRSAGTTNDSGAQEPRTT
jgi:hypothetical protein